MPDDKPDILAAPFTTAAEQHDIGNDSPPPTPGLSYSPGLREVPNSKVPAKADGTMMSHVYGPGQAAVDPIAAGLDVEHVPLTRNESRVITQTGTDGAGPRPATYAEKPGVIPQSTPGDGALVKAPSEDAANAEPGPTGASAETAPTP